MRRVLWVVLVLLAGLAVGLGYLLRERPGIEGFGHAYAPAPAAARGLNAAWFGNTAVLLSDGRHAIFIDPFFTRPGGALNVLRNAAIAPDEALIAHWLRRVGLQRLDAVLVSHSHYDHAMDAGVVAQRTGARLLGSASTLNIGRGAGLPESQLQEMRSGDRIEIGSFTVTFVESRHAGATGGRPTGDIEAPLAPPARYLDYRQGGTYSILVQHADGSLLHHGSAGFIPGVLKLRHADVVMLGIALLPDLAGYLGEVVEAVGARRVMPLHWDDFTRPLDAPLRAGLFVDLPAFFKGMAARPDLQVQVLPLAQPVALFPAQDPGP